MLFIGLTKISFRPKLITISNIIKNKPSSCKVLNKITIY